MTAFTLPFFLFLFLLFFFFFFVSRSVWSGLVWSKTTVYSLLSNVCSVSCISTFFVFSLCRWLSLSPFLSASALCIFYVLLCASMWMCERPAILIKYVVSFSPNSHFLYGHVTCIFYRLMYLESLRKISTCIILYIHSFFLQFYVLKVESVGVFFSKYVTLTFISTKNLHVQRAITSSI